MSKVRVYELAKELGLESKDVLEKLKEIGEFAKSASSTVEPPVARKLRTAVQGSSGDAAAGAPKRAPSGSSVRRPAPSGSTRRPAGDSGLRPPSRRAPSGTVRPKEEPKAKPSEAPSKSDAPAASSEAPEKVASEPTAATPAAEPTQSTPKPKPEPSRGPSPNPGNNPFSGNAPSRSPRPGGGNNPYTGNAPPRTPGGVPGAPRPTPGSMPPRPQQPNPGQMRGPQRGRGGRPGGPGGPGGRSGGPGGRPGGSGGRQGGYRGGPGGGGGGGFAGPPGGFGPGGKPGAPGGRGRPGGPGGRGRPGGKPAKSRKSKRAKRQEFDNMEAPTIGGVRIPTGEGRTVRLPRGASLTDFAERIDASSADLVTVLLKLGEMVNATQSVDDETLKLLGAELDYVVDVVSPEDEDRELLEQFDLEFGADVDESGEQLPRPPVVTVMGHVDHGKTKLLDAIREADVVADEAGGITQHIGAYQIHTMVGDTDRAITFIDTPGHEAFTAMRARGAEVTDIAILVVAADDGVKPQTVEALNHAQAAEVPIVVAVNKVDKEGADPTKVRTQLTEYGLVAEDFGGDVMFVDVSAKAKLGISELLEAVVLTADATLELTANPDQDAQGVAIEAHLDRGRGSVATVLVQRGTLHPGDSVVCGDAHGRVRAMLDEHGDSLETAGPSRPVQVLGLTTVPGAGDSFIVVPEDRVARQIAQTRQARERNASLAKSRPRRTLEEFLSQKEKGEVQELRLILKGDVSGSVEALEDALLKLEISEEVSLRIIDRGVGAITEANVMLATASDAVIIGFNVRPQGKASEMADREGVELRYYSVIYAAIEDIEAALKGMLKPEYEEVQLGTAEIREVFRSSKFGNIAGSIVRTGLIRRNSSARLVRDGTVVADNLTVESLRRFKDDATEVREGYECGIGLGSFNDIKEGDVVETFENQEKPRS